MHQNDLLQNEIEKRMEKIHLESFPEWVQNFALNLNYIWQESSAGELNPYPDSPTSYSKNSAIIIGRGPSLKKNNHLELLADSDYKGTIVCTDGALKSVLVAGVTPNRFKNFIVITVDPYSYAEKFYDDDLINKFGKKINGIFSVISKPSVVSKAREIGIKIHWIHSLFDFEEGKKSFNQISALMIRSKNHPRGLPAIQTGGNAGTSAWFVSWKILKCSIVALIGINHAWDEDEPWKRILTHGRTEDSDRKHEQLDFNLEDPHFQKLFKKIHNPEFNCNCIVDPLFQFYSEALKEFISRSPSWLTTINATEGGSIFGNRIHCMTLKKFLEKYQN